MSNADEILEEAEELPAVYELREKLDWEWVKRELAPVPMPLTFKRTWTITDRLVHFAADPLGPLRWILFKVERERCRRREQLYEEEMIRHVGQQQEAESKFLGAFQAGDECWSFSTRQELWNKLAGCSGYVIMRSGKAIAYHITMQS